MRLKKWVTITSSTATVAASGEIQVPGKCIKPYVQNAEKIAKFRSNRLKANRFSAKIATRKRKDTKNPKP
jgi:hypothetical protein